MTLKPILMTPDHILGNCQIEKRGLIDNLSFQLVNMLNFHGL